MTRRLRQAIALSREERGVALVVALLVLMITLILAAAATLAATDTNTTSNRDSKTKLALEAADGGARTAVYRLNMYRPQANYCPTVPTSVAVGSTGAPTATLCPTDGPETLGNGTSFEYWISRVLQSGDTCAGTTVDSSQSDVAQRCVTALGTANGVSARVQERVVAYTSTPVFPAAIFGTKSVTVNNNATIVSNTQGSPALLGTNGTLYVAPSGGGTTTIDGYQIPTGASLQMGQNVINNGPATSNAPAYPTPTPINPGTTSQNTASPFDTSSTYQQGTCAEPSSWSGTWVQTNCDYRITRGLTYAGCLSGGAPVTDCDPGSGVTFTASTRTLSLANNATLTLGGGYYNFCSVTLGNKASIKIASGAKVSIYVDSPYDANSGAPSNAPAGSATNSACASGSGTLTMNQNSTFNDSGTALNAQIYVYGNPSNPTSNIVSLQNNGQPSFLLVAPYSDVQLNPSNNTTFVGAIVGYTVELGNASHFTYEADAGTLQSGSLDLFYRSYWEQCPTASSSGTDPTAGC